MRRQHARSQIASKAERNQVHAFTEIARVTADLALPEQAKEHACMLFKRAQEEDLLRGRSIEGFAAPGEYLPRYASELSLPTAVETRAREHLEGLREDRHVCGRDPSGVAAGCLYAAAKDHGRPLTQREAANVADVTPVTLRATVKAIRGDTE
jgi:transcription initiation factor TFIIB